MNKKEFEMRLARICDDKFNSKHTIFARDDFIKRCRQSADKYLLMCTAVKHFSTDSVRMRFYIYGWKDSAIWHIAQEFREFDISSEDIAGLLDSVKLQEEL